LLVDVQLLIGRLVLHDFVGFCVFADVLLALVNSRKLLRRVPPKEQLPTWIYRLIFLIIILNIIILNIIIIISIIIITISIISIIIIITTNVIVIFFIASIVIIFSISIISSCSKLELNLHIYNCICAGVSVQVHRCARKRLRIHSCTVKRCRDAGA
jgi:hypothetical protein